MFDLPLKVATEAMRQALVALESIPADASVGTRCNAVTSAVRAIAAYTDVIPMIEAEAKQERSYGE